MKFLVVDDSDMNRALLTWILTDLGHTVLEANSGEEAVELVIHYKPDMIFMDVQMPKMDGVMATEVIRKDPANRFIPIVFVTATITEEVIAKCIGAGGTDFIDSPVTEVDVFNAINKHLSV